MQRRLHSSRSESAMDQEHFDAVARAMSRGGSRRDALRLLIGGTFVGWLARDWLTVRATQQGPSCDSVLTYCSGNCVDLSSDYLNCGGCGSACPSAGPDVATIECIGGTCVQTACAPGYANCFGGVDSGGNVGNVISVGDTSGPVWVDGGDVSNSTTIDISADGGTAISEAGGGSGNVAVD